MVHQIIVLWCIVNVKSSEINTHELLSVRDTLVRYSLLLFLYELCVAFLASTTIQKMLSNSRVFGHLKNITLTEMKITPTRATDMYAKERCPKSNLIFWLIPNYCKSIWLPLSKHGEFPLFFTYQKKQSPSHLQIFWRMRRLLIQTCYFRCKITVKRVLRRSFNMMLCLHKSLLPPRKYKVTFDVRQSAVVRVTKWFVNF